MSTCWVCSAEYEGDGPYCRSAECLSEMKRRAGRVSRRPSPDGPVYIEVNGYYFLKGTSSVARYLGVHRRQADAWFKRRDRNGFPPSLRVLERGVVRQVFDPDEVSEWRRDYEPSAGGAPSGERNGSWVDGHRRRIDEDGTRRRSA